MFLPLSSLKIIEFESEPISSFCGTILSDFGADVIIITQTKEPQTTIPIEEDFL